jgi:hypothetical protein
VSALLAPVVYDLNGTTLVSALVRGRVKWAALVIHVTYPHAHLQASRDLTTDITVFGDFILLQLAAMAKAAQATAKELITRKTVTEFENYIVRYAILGQTKNPKQNLTDAKIKFESSGSDSTTLIATCLLPYMTKFLTDGESDKEKDKKKDSKKKRDKTGDDSKKEKKAKKS